VYMRRAGLSASAELLVLVILSKINEMEKKKYVVYATTVNSFRNRLYNFCKEPGYI